VILLLLGLAIALIVFLVSGGHVIFLPLILILPLSLFGLRRRTRRF